MPGGLQGEGKLRHCSIESDKDFSSNTPHLKPAPNGGKRKGAHYSSDLVNDLDILVSQPVLI